MQAIQVANCLPALLGLLVLTFFLKEDNWDVLFCRAWFKETAAKACLEKILTQTWWQWVNIWAESSVTVEVYYSWDNFIHGSSLDHPTELLLYTSAIVVLCHTVMWNISVTNEMDFTSVQTGQTSTHDVSGTIHSLYHKITKKKPTSEFFSMVLDTWSM